MISRSRMRRCGMTGGLCVLAATLAYTVQCTAAPLVHVEVYDRETGRALDQHYHRGQRYVAGEPGHEYSVRVRNLSDGRLLAVVSVDGVNAVTGETASPDQSGYVIDPGEVVDIVGWRKNLERAAAFYFTNLGDAYATRTGRPGNVGVIGVAAFRERVYPAIAAEPQIDKRADETSRAAQAKSAEGSGDAGNKPAPRTLEQMRVTGGEPLGTGHGRQQYSPARRVQFERRSAQPDELLAVRYDSVERLIARGVIENPRYHWDDPEPFPATLGFVPDP